MSVFNRKLNAVKNHITDNKGDENVAKMIWIAVAFIVGAIILALLTWAFKGPISEWFSDVIDSWFGRKGEGSSLSGAVDTNVTSRPSIGA